MLLVIDNYDSFTYNLVQYLGEMGVEMKIVRNDEVTLDDVRRVAKRLLDGGLLVTVVGRAQDAANSAVKKEGG